MSTKTENQILTVKWYMQDKKLVKFNELEDTFTLSEKVAKFDHSKYGVKAGVKVEVGFNGKEVSYLRKSEQENISSDEKEEPTQKEEVKPTGDKLSPTENKTHNELTVAGIVATKEVISFKEDTGHKWYQVPEELRKDLDSKGVKARARVKVVVDTSTPKPSIVSIEVIPEVELSEKEQPIVSQAAKTVNTKGSYDNRNESIERQCSIKAASIAIATAFAGKLTPDQLEKETLKLSEAVLKFIQNR